jgi:hypothetical protein
MQLEDRIIEAEGTFYNRYLIRPNILVVRPEIKSVLMSDMGGDIFGDDMFYYEGLKVLVTFDDAAADFALGFVG